MHPQMIAGAISFGEQTRRCHELRQALRQLEPKLAEEQATALWDEIESERKKRS
jgi:HPt (histidine-containing phosphotransfer) domain-containing protein